MKRIFKLTRFFTLTVTLYLLVGAKTFAQFPVVWVNKVGVTEDLNGTITNSTGVNGWNLSGAASANKILTGTDGWVETVVGQTNKIRIIGLSEKEVGADQTTVDFGAYLNSGGYLYVYEKGASMGVLESYAIGDTIRIERISGVIYYKKNGVVVYTSTKLSSSQLVVDVAFNHDGGSIENTTCSVGATYATEPSQAATNLVVGNITDSSVQLSWTNGNGSNRVVLAQIGNALSALPLDGNDYYNPSLTYGIGSTFENLQYAVYNGDNSDNSSVTVDGLLPGTEYHFAVIEYNQSNGAANNYLITDYSSLSATTQTVPTTSYPVVWTNLQEVNLDSNNNLEARKKQRYSWTSGASSFNRLNEGEDGWAEMTLQIRNKNQLFGFSETDVDASQQTIDYAIYCYASIYYIYERGVIVSNLGSSVIGDVLRVERSNGIIYYKRNGEVVYISKMPSNSSLIVDTSIQLDGGTIENVFMSKEGVAIYAPEPTVPASALTVDELGNDRVSLSWTNGNGQKRLVVCYPQQINGMPLDSYLYNNPQIAFGPGNQVGNNGYLVFNSTENTATIGNLPPATTYQIAVIEYNEGENVSTNYLTSVIASTSITTTGVAGIGVPVTWTNLVGVSVSNDTIASTEPNGWNNSGAASVEWIDASRNGWVETTATETSTVRSFGLSKTDLNAHYSTINYSIYFQNNATYKVLESNVDVGFVDTYETGDVFRVERAGSGIHYLKNDSIIYSSNAKTTDSLLVDISFYTLGGTLSNVKLYNGAFTGGLIDDVVELDVLKDLYMSLGGDNWTNRTNWPDSANWPVTATIEEISTWYGVTVENGDITELNFVNNNLSGSLPSSIVDLKALTYISFNNNNISGVIPSSIGNLKGLKVLSIFHNQLTGSIPAEIGNLTNLTNLNLGSNQLSGSLPTELGNLIKMSDMRLNTNQLSGSIPSTIGNMYNLKVLHLHVNQLTGNIPKELGNLYYMQYFYLNSNQLTGEIPGEIMNYSGIRIFNLSNNQLTGDIPEWRCSSPYFQQLILNINQLTGTIPESFSTINSLQVLYLYNNNMEGEIPESIAQMVKLTNLTLYSNSFASLPNFSAHPNAATMTLRVEDNNLPLSDIEANLNGDGTHGFVSFTYSNQAATPMEYPLTVVIEGNQLVIDTHDASPNNSFVWEHETGGVWTDVTAQNENATGDRYVKTVTSADAGKYRYTVTNSVLNTSKGSNEIDIKTIHPKQLFLNNWAFQYKYDGRKRMTEKRVPGAGWVYMVYDNRDRLVLSQDSIQRENNVWLFTKYDVFNRPVVTGIYTHGSQVLQPEMQDIVDQYYEDVDNEVITGEWYETFDGTEAPGYTNESFPNQAGLNYLTVTYYDNYLFRDELLSEFGSEYNYYYNAAEMGCITTNAEYCYEEVENENVKGQVTGSMVKNLGDNTWLRTATYYDDKYRVIQVVADNHLGGLDRTSNLYDFVGKVLQTKTDHEVGTETNVTLQTNTYDHAGRLLEVKNKQDEEAEITLASNTYNEIGELIEKDLHSENGTDFMQYVDYSYNIRGWLTAINDAALSDNEDYFGMELLYNEEEGVIGNTGLYNGNISAIKWNGGLAGTEEQAYAYTYDPMNRLTNATSKKMFTGGLWLNGSTNVTVGEYDLNGNIKVLTRNSANGPMDILTYNYDGGGNQLQFVSDTGLSTEGFIDGNSSGNDYSYDGNGNMIEDKNKDIASITYNHLNLPERVEKTDGQYLTYVYDAAGIKLAQEVHDTNGDLIKRTDYSGAYVYETEGTGDRTLQFIQTQEGRIVPGEPGTPSEYQYYLKDHLGNTRITFTSKDNVETYLATMEDEYATYEEATFSNVAETRQQDQLFNNTQPDGTVAIPDNSSMLNSTLGRIIGPAQSLEVGRGDKVSMEVWAKYASYSGDGTKVLSNTMLGAIADAFTPVGASGEVIQATLDLFTAAGAGALSPGPNTDAPAAYLNYLLFDANYTLVQSGFEAITTSAEGAFEQLMMNDVEIEQDGYIYIYVSNEDASNVSVYFDDLKVTHTKSRIVQMEDYYPFGLTFNSYQRPNTTEQRWKFQGQEHVDDLGLNWDSFKWRNHQPDIGRFFNIDPLADKYVYNSPYAFAENRVVDGRELEGLEWVQSTDGQWDYDSTIPDGSMQAASWVTTDECGVQSLSVGGPNGTIQTYLVNENGMVELPYSGDEQAGAATSGSFTVDGYTIYDYYNRNDVSGGVEDQWGKPQDIADMINSIVEYKVNYPNDVIAIGDMKSPANGKVNLTSTRLHHGDKGAFDLRLLGNQGSMPAGSTINSTNFSSERTQALFESLGKHGFTRFLIGPNAIYNLCSPSGSCYVIDGGTAHNNHYHVDKH